MGLMYIFPAKEEEIDRITVDQQADDKVITLKTYGLPMIFWGYMVATLTVIFFMFLAIKASMDKMIAGEDIMNQFIALGVYSLFVLGPLTFLGFFFYEKRFTKVNKSLIITQHVFWLPITKRAYTLKQRDSFLVSHFMNSPNIAKINNDPELKGFENSGYWELWAKLEDNSNIQMDRHNRKLDLIQISKLLSQY